MRIATLQFSPRLGDVYGNIARANALLEESILASLPSPTYQKPLTQPSDPLEQPSSAGTPSQLDLLVLPELAFSGYNFSSLEAILPFLEPTAAGPSTQWAKETARRYGCVVSVGYPELYHSESDPGRDGKGFKERIANGHSQNQPHRGADDSGSSVNGTNGDIIDSKFSGNTSSEPRSPEKSSVVAYNSLITVSPTGEVLAHYRKTHLYYTDETWASESPDGFFTSDIDFTTITGTSSPSSQSQVKAQKKVAWGICMDINPHRFTAPWTAHEYCASALSFPSVSSSSGSTSVDMCVLSMAWLTSSPPSPSPPSSPDRRAHDDDEEEPGDDQMADESKEATEPEESTFSYWLNRLQPLVFDSSKRRIVVVANRCGKEPGKSPLGVWGDVGVEYAGTSWIGVIGGADDELAPGNGANAVNREGAEKVKRGRVEVWAMLGKKEEVVCFADIPDVGSGHDDNTVETASGNNGERIDGVVEGTVESAPRPVLPASKGPMAVYTLTPRVVPDSP